MQPKFKAPATEAEFRERADKTTIEGARNLLGILRKQREDAVKPFDEEIKYWKKVVDYKQKHIDGQTEMPVGDEK